MTCGELEHYDKTYDHLDAKVEKPLERLERTFFNVTTSDDPVIRDLGAAGKANVFATDRILSLIMVRGDWSCNEYHWRDYHLEKCYL